MGGDGDGHERGVGEGVGGVTGGAGPGALAGALGVDTVAHRAAAGRGGCGGRGRCLGMKVATGGWVSAWE